MLDIEDWIRRYVPGIFAWVLLTAYWIIILGIATILALGLCLCTLWLYLVFPPSISKEKIERLWT